MTASVFNPFFVRPTSRRRASHVRACAADRDRLEERAPSLERRAVRSTRPCAPPLSTTPCTTTPHRVARKTRLAAFLALFGPVSRPSSRPNANIPLPLAMKIKPISAGSN